MLQQPVSPRIPHLHRVVHASSSNAGTAGVEVHIGDKTGEIEQSYTIRHLPWVGWTQSVLSLCVCSQFPQPRTLLYQVAKRQQTADDNSDQQRHKVDLSGTKSLPLFLLSV